MAPDLVKALEYSKQPVPRDLKELADECKERIKQVRPNGSTRSTHGTFCEYSGYRVSTPSSPRVLCRG